jgi:hypothetical protein
MIGDFDLLNVMINPEGNVKLLEHRTDAPFDANQWDRGAPGLARCVDVHQRIGAISVAKEKSG